MDVAEYEPNAGGSKAGTASAATRRGHEIECHRLLGDVNIEVGRGEADIFEGERTVSVADGR